MLSKSFTSILISSPHQSVPAFPGAINSLLHELLCEIFQANACSLPPLPRINTFILSFLIYPLPRGFPQLNPCYEKLVGHHHFLLTNQ